MINKTVKFVRVSGLKALERLQEGGIVATRDGKSVWKIIDDQLHYRCPVEGFRVCHDQLNTFLNPSDDDWFIEATPFDVRKELLAHPGEWVGKYYDEKDDAWKYVGFDKDEMIVVISDRLKSKVAFDCHEDGTCIAEHAKKIVRLEKEESYILVSNKNK